MTNISIEIGVLNRARHRNDMVVCPGCERRVARKSRQQTYCSPKCRARGHYKKNGRGRVFYGDWGRDSAFLTDPLIKDSDFNALQWSKSGSSTGIVGPQHVIQAEVFGSREWHEVISADGVRSQVSTLGRCALVN